MTSIGIDLGTTNTAAAEKVGELPEVVHFDGERTMRSAVTFTPGDDEVIVGNEAVDYLEDNPELTITSIKREMGTDYTVEIDDDSYTLGEYSPEAISALILRKVIDTAESTLGSRPESAVITVPADFPEPARRATERAAELAGIDCLRLLPEPSAACAAYGLREREDPIETVAVYDLGGGTFDISIVEIVHEADVYEVVGTDGDQQLGGDDFDQALVDHVVSEFEAETGIDLSTEPTQLERVRRKAKQAKHKLSSASEAEIRVPFVAPDQNLEQTVTRETFEELTADLVAETTETTRALVEELDVTFDDIDTVLLVGGSTKMPQVRDAVAELFGQEPSQEVNPDEAVAQGAAKQAAIISQRTALPGEEPSGEPLPDEGGIFDVAPDSLGIRLADGSFDRIIERNETLPVKHTEDGYTTVEDEQQRAKIQVYQGESDVAEENEHIESFVLEDIRSAPAGVPDLVVEFELDENGVLRTTAWDKSIGDEAGGDVEISVDDGGADGDDLAQLRRDLPDVI
jgi:molecular chaperone DnaK